MNISSKTRLNNGVEMPWLGLGVFEAQEGGEVENAIRVALENGYRSIDTASFYKNETGVGKAIRQSGILREELFVTTKMWNNEQGYRNTLQAFETSLEKLQVGYIDLYLVHWPIKRLSGETWKALEELYGKGKVRAIGVSNFLIHHLEDFLPGCKIKPMVNQVEFHPEVAQPEMIEYCKTKQIQLEAWSPMMKGKVNEIPVLLDLSQKYGKSPVQIVLRWDIQKGVVTIPKSVTPERIIANADIFDFEISPNDMEKIDRLDKNQRTGFHPDTFYLNF